jgi:hypothetical protein
LKLFDVFIYRERSFNTGITKETYIDVFFKENEFPIIQLQRKFTELDFLSYIGGTLGLFAGFSFLTILELLFYFTFRPAVRKVKCKSRVAPLQAWTQEASPRNNKALKLVRKSTSYFYHYMEESSLHGLNHASFKNLRLVERIFWLVAFVTSLILCGFLLNDLFVKYLDAPVIITFDGDLKNIEEVCESTTLIRLEVFFVSFPSSFQDFFSGGYSCARVIIQFKICEGLVLHSDDEIRQAL